MCMQCVRIVYYKDESKWRTNVKQNRNGIYGVIFENFSKQHSVLIKRHHRHFSHHILYICAIRFAFECFHFSFLQWECAFAFVCTLYDCAYFWHKMVVYVVPLSPCRHTNICPKNGGSCCARWCVEKVSTTFWPVLITFHKLWPTTTTTTKRSSIIGFL